MRDQFGINAFLKGFPFIENYAKADRIEEVSVLPITAETMRLLPSYDGATGSCVDIDDNLELLFLDEAGKCFYKLKQEISIRHNEAHTDNEYEYGERVEEGLLHGIPEYILKIHTGYNIKDHQSVGGFSVTVFLKSLMFSMERHLKEKNEKAKLTLFKKIKA